LLQATAPGLPPLLELKGPRIISLLSIYSKSEIIIGLRSALIGRKKKALVKKDWIHIRLPALPSVISSFSDYAPTGRGIW
jgi:hypothetical protein